MQSSSSSLARPLRLPQLPDPSEPVSLPDGWTLNDRSELVNEQGDVMFDIREEADEPVISRVDEDASRPPVASGSSVKLEDLKGKGKSKLKPEVLAVLDQLEAQEPSDPESQHDSSPQPDAPYRDDPRPRKRKELDDAERERDEVRNWGRSDGFGGFRGVFAGKTSTRGPTFPAPASCDPPPSEPAKAVRPSRPRKSVSFADKPETIPLADDEEDVVMEDVTPAAPTKERRTVTLGEVMEHTPAEAMSVDETPPAPTKPNGRTAHLDPRLAALLPKSYLPASSADSQPDDPHDDVDEDIFEDDEDDEDDGSDSSGSVFSYSDQDDDATDLTRTMDLRQAAMAYHALRPSLGAGAGTGPLGGDGPPVSSGAGPLVNDDDEQWVPVDTKLHAEGVPRDPPGESAFRSGGANQRKIESSVGLKPGTARVVDGKLFGSKTLVSGPSDSTVDGGREERDNDELSPEEMALLTARIDAMAMSPEEREAAERVGGELWELMRKVSKGEVVLEEEEGEEDRPPEVKRASGEGKRKEVKMGEVQERSETAAPTAPVEEDGPPPKKKVSRFKAQRLGL